MSDKESSGDEQLKPVKGSVRNRYRPAEAEQTVNATNRDEPRYRPIAQKNIVVMGGARKRNLPSLSTTASKQLSGRNRYSYKPLLPQKIEYVADINEGEQYEVPSTSTAGEQLDDNVLYYYGPTATQKLRDMVNFFDGKMCKPSRFSIISNERLEARIRRNCGPVTTQGIVAVANKGEQDKPTSSSSTASAEEFCDSDEEPVHDSSTASATSSSERQALLMYNRESDMSLVIEDEADENNSSSCNITPESSDNQLKPKTSSSGLINSKNITQETSDGKNICNICMRAGTTQMNRGMTCMLCHTYYHQNCTDPPITVDVTVRGFRWCCQSCIRQLIRERNPIVLPITNLPSTSYAASTSSNLGEGTSRKYYNTLHPSPLRTLPSKPKKSKHTKNFRV